MKHKIELINSQKVYKITPQIKALVKEACATVLECEDFSSAAEVSVTFVDDEQIKELNNQFRNIDSSTDVLSFPLGDGGVWDINPQTNRYLLGDVVLSMQHAEAQSDLYGHSLEREVAYLTVHSMLHLLGYDHVNGEDERKIMRKREEIALEKMGLSIKTEGENNG